MYTEVVVAEVVEDNTAVQTGQGILCPRCRQVDVPKDFQSFGRSPHFPLGNEDESVVQEDQTNRCPFPI